MNINLRNPIHREIAAVLAVAAATTLSLAAGFSQLTPPAAAPADSPAGQFSAMRALRHVQAIAQRPRPMGTQAHEDAAAYIEAGLRALGLEVQTQKTLSILNVHDRTFLAARVRNIMARIRGRQGGSAVLLAGHYDSEPTGPGASDNGAAVAALLETARALAAEPQMENDVVFLFSDGEEVELLGARAFAGEHPWRDSIGIVLNFEARGTAGPSIMYESNGPGGFPAGEFLGAAPHPVAYSYATAVYGLMGNITDFDVLKRESIPGLNFAFIDGAYAYSNAFDNLQHLDPASLQHHGSNALALARYFGGRDQAAARAAGPDVYFNIAGSWLAHYPKTTGLFLAIAGAIALLVAGIAGVRRKILTVKNMLAGLAVLLATVIIAAILSHLAWLAVKRIHPQSLKLYWDLPILAGLVFLTAGLMSLAGNWAARKFNGANILYGYLLLLAAIALAVSFALPGAGYLFVWPLLLGLPALWPAVRPGDHGPGSWLGTGLACIGVIPVMTIAAPAIYLIFIALTLDLAGLLMLPVALFAGLMLQAVFLHTDRIRRYVTMALFLAGAILLGASGLRIALDKDYLKEDTLFYCLNADTGRAVWASADKQTDEWTSLYLRGAVTRDSLGAYVPGAGARKYAISEAPVAGLQAPAVTTLESKRNKDSRTIRCRITPAAETLSLSMHIASGVEVVNAAVDGRELAITGQADTSRPAKPWSLTYYNMPPEGIELVLTVKPDQLVEMRLTGRSEGFAGLGGIEYRARPEHITPAAIGANEPVFVSKSFLVQ